MKNYFIIPVVLLWSLSVQAEEHSAGKAPESSQYSECVAVSLFTQQGRELNAAVENKRAIEKTNAVPAGWSVVGVTSKTERGQDEPYMVICH